MRTFIAVELAKDILEKIDDFIFKTYREIDKNKISWVKKENLHITLKFLGEINENQIEVVKFVLKDVSKNFKEFTIFLEGLGFFPNLKFPKVIWIGIKKHEDKLKLLASLIEESLSKHGFLKEKKEFIPHLTIARIKQIKKINEIISYAEKYKSQTFGISEIKSITFFQSILKPEGPQYRIIEKLFLNNS